MNGGFAGRQIHLRVGAPWWLKVSLSRKRRGQGLPGLPEHNSLLLHTLSLRGLAGFEPSHPALALSRAPSHWAFAHRSLPARGLRLGRQDEQYYTFLEVGRF